LLAGFRDQQPHRDERAEESNGFCQCQCLAEEKNRERRGDREIEPKDRRIGADRAASQAAGEIEQGDEQKKSGEPAPQC
jgi:hypothetical protein